MDFVDFLDFFLVVRNFLKIFGGSWRSLKNFAMLSGGWKEGMVWLQDFLENENGPSGFFCLDFLDILENILEDSGFLLDFVRILWIWKGFAVKLGSPGGSGDRPFQGQRLLLPDAEHRRTNISYP